MKIYVFGCSWSIGVYRSFSIEQRDNDFADPCKADFSSWASELASMFPQHDITNYALPGSDIVFSIACLNKVLADKDYDKIIFQVTNTYRFTYWNDVDLSIHLRNYSKNYKRFSESVVNDVTPSSVAENFIDRSKDTSFMQNYIGRVNGQREEAMHGSLVKYAENNSDLCFSHINMDHLDITSIERETGDDFFKYVCDHGLHFGDNGNKWQAEWVAEQLKL